MNKSIAGLGLICALFFLSCAGHQQKENQTLEIGLWRGTLDIGDEEEIPFLFNIKDNGEGYSFEFINGEERILTTDIELIDDSLVVKMPVFNSAFFLSISDKDKLVGHWQNFNRKTEYIIPFEANFGISTRFIPPENPIMDDLGKEKWQVSFSPSSDSASPAIGLFNYENTGRVLGTFATEKGDFRFLEGLYCDSLLRLSCFDGSHAFLFKAKKMQDGSLNGHFWSGHKWKEKWVATENADFELSNPDSLTRLIVPEDSISFSFPDLEGNIVAKDDDRFKNKALIIQILGSWCPNCADESKFLQELHNKYSSEGLEIVGLCFESSPDQVIAADRIKRFRESLGLEYQMLIAGNASKKEATEILGFVDNISSFPTSIYIDKNGKVKKIHTGFYGPGTGEYYHQFVSETNSLVEEMLH